MLHIIWYIIVGFIVGLIARAVMPGVQHLGFIMTTVIGIGGSIIGGLIARLFSRPEPDWGIGWPLSSIDRRKMKRP